MMCIYICVYTYIYIYIYMYIYIYIYIYNLITGAGDGKNVGPCGNPFCTTGSIARSGTTAGSLAGLLYGVSHIPMKKSANIAYVYKLYVSEVGGLRPTGKSFRFVRACAQLYVRSEWISKIIPHPFSLLPFGPEMFSLFPSESK